MLRVRSVLRTALHSLSALLLIFLDSIKFQKCSLTIPERPTNSTFVVDTNELEGKSVSRFNFHALAIMCKPKLLKLAHKVSRNRKKKQEQASVTHIGDFLISFMDIQTYFKNEQTKRKIGLQIRKKLQHLNDIERMLN